MEENNNGLLIKWLAVIFIASLGLEVYRVETTRKDLARVDAAVHQLADKLDSLSTGGLPAGSTTSAQGVTRKQFAALSKSVSNLESKVAALQGGVERIAHGLTQVESRAKEAPASPSATQSDANPGEVKARPAVTRVTVSAKAQLENRYVTSEYLPKVSTGPTGKVVLNIVVTRTGTVVSTSISSSSTLVVADIVDACKEAALKTGFSYNPDAPDKQRGTITYTFTPKLR